MRIRDVGEVVAQRALHLAQPLLGLLADRRGTSSILVLDTVTDLTDQRCLLEFRLAAGR
ncbi:hypothetical protein [Nocardia sp. CA-119907]|uniref:hypothetical protein n=1 Tax=Nocardia sp. CA-119907 TaxID=3239973 RepID=UPI003D960A00